MLNIATTTFATNSHEVTTTHSIPVRISFRPDMPMLNSSKKCSSNLIKIRPSKLKATVSQSVPSFFLINARSLLPKIDELSLLLSIYPLEFIAVTETWLTDTIPDQVIHMNNYNVFRNDRSHSRGGGVCAFTSTSIPAKRRTDLENPLFECLWLWLRPYRLPRDLTGIICCVLYNPPDTPISDQQELTAYLIDKVDLIRSTSPNCGVVLLGDFNGLDISDLLCHHNLTQTVDTPTRNSNILDLIVTNLEAMYCKPVTMAPLGSSDHNIVKWAAKTINERIDNKTIKKNVRSFPRSARESFGRWCHSRQWFTNVESKRCASSLAFSFTNELNTAVDYIFPSKVIKIHNSDKPWMTPVLKKLINQRQKAFHSGNLDLWRHYRLKVRNDIAVKKRTYYTNKVRNLKSRGSRKWWDCVNQMSGKKKSAPGNIKIIRDGTILSGNDLVQSLNTFFFKCE